MDFWQYKIIKFFTSITIGSKFTYGHQLSCFRVETTPANSNKNKNRGEQQKHHDSRPKAKLWTLQVRSHPIKHRCGQFDLAPLTWVRPFWPDPLSHANSIRTAITLYFKQGCDQFQLSPYPREGNTLHLMRERVTVEVIMRRSKVQRYALVSVALYFGFKPPFLNRKSSLWPNFRTTWAVVNSM